MILPGRLLTERTSCTRGLGRACSNRSTRWCWGGNLSGRGLAVERQKAVSFEFEGMLEDGLRVDLLVEGVVVVELKSVENRARPLETSFDLPPLAQSLRGPVDQLRRRHAERGAAPDRQQLRPVPFRDSASPREPAEKRAMSSFWAVGRTHAERGAAEGREGAWLSSLGLKKVDSSSARTSREEHPCRGSA